MVQELTEGSRAHVDLSRMVIVGCSASGKSTLARALAERTGVPWVQLDALYWAADWQPRPEREFLARVEAATRGPRWIVDGNYRVARDLFWPRATAVVWLNLPFPTVFARCLRRTIARGVTREALYSGNRESLWRSFTSRDSILWWVVTSYRPGRRDYAALRRSGRYAAAWHELRRPADVRRFLQAAGAARQGTGR